MAGWRTPDELIKETGPEFLLRTQPSPDVLPSPSLPMQVARKFFQSRCIDAGAPILAHWRDSWHQWKRASWGEVPDQTMRNWLYHYTEKANYIDGKGKQKPWAPNRNKIANVFEALKAVCPLEDENEQPYWIDKRETGIIVACQRSLRLRGEGCPFPLLLSNFNCEGLAGLCPVYDKATGNHCLGTNICTAFHSSIQTGHVW
jgi:hypothetical protein